jgi:hypothetical protein
MGIMLLWNEVLEHEKSFNEYLHFVGAGDAPRAVEAARTLLAGIRSTLEKIQKEYPDLVIGSRMPDYWEVRKRFDGDAFDHRELAALASKLDSYVKVMQMEVDRHRLIEPPKWRVFFRRQKRTLIIAAAAALAVVVMVWGLMKLLHRGQGLVGEYYSDMELGVFYRTRLDREINFSWGRNGPFPGWRKDRFSVRWSGFLLVPETGYYDIYVHIDDGGRFYLDNKMAADDWNVQKLRVIQIPRQLEAGYHPIRLDFFERTKWATVKLFWKRAGAPRPEPIPGKYLCPSEEHFKKGIPVHARMEPGPEEDQGDTEDATPPAAAGE